MKLLFDRKAADKGHQGCFQSTGQMAQMLCITGQWKSVCPGWGWTCTCFFLSFQQTTVFSQFLFIYICLIFTAQKPLASWHESGFTTVVSAVLLQRRHMLHITSCQSWFICCGQNTSRSEQLEISESRVFLKPKPFGKWPKCEPSFSPMFPFLGLKTNQADKQTFNPVFFFYFCQSITHVEEHTHTHTHESAIL